MRYTDSEAPTTKLTPLQQRRAALISLAERIKQGRVADPYREMDKAMDEIQRAAIDELRGTGACVCKYSPERRKADAARMHESFDAWNGCMTLDHRCAHHGEKAQAKLWGRHKTVELDVTAAQWLSLGVDYPS